MQTWKAKWIMPPAYADVTPVEPDPKDSPAEFQNRHFRFTKTVTAADPAGEPIVVSISADDYYVLYINDTYVCQGPAPSYLFRYAWNRKDVSAYMKPGENRIDVHVFSQGLYNRVWESADLRCGLFCQIEQGDTVLAATDADWLCAEDLRYTGKEHTGYHTQFLEHYDCRLTLTEPKPAVVTENPVYVLDENPAFIISLQPKKPVREWMLLPDAEKRPMGGMLYDFGTEIAAHIKLSLVGHEGDQIRLLAGEELLTDADPDSMTAEDGVRHEMRCNCNYDETITLAEGKNEIRQFDYKTFRYVEIRPVSGSPAWDLSADARYAPFRYEHCSLETNDDRLADVFRICKEGVRVGAQEVFMDCPHREKGQYAGDLTITSHSHLWLTGDVTMLERAIIAQLDSARYFPGIRAVTPGALDQKIADYSLQLPILLKRHYDFTKNLDFLRAAMPTLTGMIEYFKTFMNGDGLLEGVDTMWNLVDWPKNLRDGYDFVLEPVPEEGPHCVLNAFWTGCLYGYEELCRISGTDYAPIADSVKEAFNNAFFDKADRCYHDSRKTTHSALQSNCIPLYYDICPEGYRDAVAEVVIGKGIRAGVYVTYFMLHGLCSAGYRDAAYRFLICDEAWYNMVKEGATTCYEAWGKEQKWNTSLCHPWASAPVSVLIEGILGYRLDGSRKTPELPDGVFAEIRWK
ncbi:MAG: family 78 glycoside hydrolase catalytic domain [Clostridia bacterium]|nr:family 78 glycoside hydrolase catalytic domain [Clostridia bacterium]